MHVGMSNTPVAVLGVAPALQLAAAVLLLTAQQQQLRLPRLLEAELHSYRIPASVYTCL